MPARQYQACKPGNRLVGRELERRWEEALKLRKQLEEEHDRWLRSLAGWLSTDDERAIRSLADELPAVRRAATTTAAERQRIVRLLLEAVRVTVAKTSERATVELHWAGGLLRPHELDRRVSRYDRQADYPRLVERLGVMCEQRLSSSAIAEQLNAEGFRPPKRTRRFTDEMARRLAARLGMLRRPRPGGHAGLGPAEYRPTDLGRLLGVTRDTIRRWFRLGWVEVRRDEDSHHIIRADESEVNRLREFHRLPRTWANRERLEGLKRPKPHSEG